MNEKKKIWTLAELKDGHINNVSYEIIARAAGLKKKLSGSTITTILLGPAIGEEELALFLRRGADSVILLEDKRLSTFLVEDHANALAELVRREKPYIFLAGATSYGRTLMPYLATKFFAGLTADCTILEIEEETGLLLQTRPAIGGNILATIKTTDARPQMATIRPHSTKPLEEDPEHEKKRLQSPDSIRREKPDEGCFVSRVEYIGTEELAEDGGALKDARKIVSGGRGLKKGENFSLVNELADLLGASTGASREAVDRGWVSYPHQVGLSGKTVSPDLYISVGISGSIQHLAGMQTAEHIIAIDEDPEAQIFKVADLAVQGDLFTIVPLLCERLRKRMEGHNTGRRSR